MNEHISLLSCPYDSNYENLFSSLCHFIFSMILSQLNLYFLYNIPADNYIDRAEFIALTSLEIPPSNENCKTHPKGV